MIKEVHIFIEGGGDDRLVQEIVQALHPEWLNQPGLRLFRHDVTDWPGDPTTMAAVKLRLEHNISLTPDSSLLQVGNAYGKRLFLVMLKA